MSKLIKVLTVITILIISALPLWTVNAQDSQPEGPIYLVQPGDNLTLIASRFGISAEDLILANSIIDPNNLKVGDQLIIPGLTGVKGFLVTQTVGFGNTLRQLSIENQVDEKLLIKLNHITSPSELYAGVNLVIPQLDSESNRPASYLLQTGQSLMEFAILAGENPWSLMAANELSGSYDLYAGQDIFINQTGENQPSALKSSPFKSVNIDPLPLVQGRTLTVQIETNSPVELSGSLTDHPLNFFPTAENKYVSIHGIHAMMNPGVYPLKLSARLPDGTAINFEQMVIIQDGFYGKDPVILVKDEFIDPTVTEPEIKWLAEQTNPATPDKLWDGQWISPSPFSYLDCLNSRYGNRRSYNGSEFTYFHSGVDFCGGEGVQIFAPARGRVIFAGMLAVRGNATIIDHGWGIYSGYWHQSKIDVTVGDMVEAGQVIGYVGGTGRVTGAHLHWEVWAGGVQVNPIDWLETVYPPSN